MKLRQLVKTPCGPAEVHYVSNDFCLGVIKQTGSVQYVYLTKTKHPINKKTYDLLIFLSQKEYMQLLNQTETNLVIQNDMSCWAYRFDHQVRLMGMDLHRWGIAS